MQRLEFVQFVPAPMQTVWEFFSSPQNLSVITPSSMGFIITSPLPVSMYAGMFISYKVKPLLGVPINWVTEITEIDEYNYFIDEQRSGPYKIWHHEHHFIAKEGGVEIRDVLYYKVSPGFIGNLLDRLFVKNKVLSIFKYRERKIEELFGVPNKIVLK